MKVGDLVESRHPRMHSPGYGVILSMGRIKQGPIKCSVYWSKSNKITRCVSFDLEVINESQ